MNQSTLVMCSMFQECPNPDESVRIALSKRLGLDPLRVKFWFQNRRNAKKVQTSLNFPLMFTQDLIKY